MSTPVEQVAVTVLTIPAEDRRESDATIRWSATTMVLVECRAQGTTGIGYTYAHAAAAKLAVEPLVPCIEGLDAMAIAEAHARMLHAVRNQGRDDIAAAATAALDNALWDLKARLLGVSLAALLGRARSEVPVYASGGFPSTPLDALQRELAEYAERGFGAVKIKIGREPAQDEARVRCAREALGPGIADGRRQRRLRA
ncbi:MAG TPA: enolase C-terminal domain-like protein [Polyangiales bacterium]|nr:enolase C-terminal domain-like protein [Polyangiales bacterium]